MADRVPEPDSPNSCGACGIDQHNHYRRWNSAVRWHTWLEPTDEQRKARMIARREARCG